MTRCQRRIHAALWLILTPALLIGLIALGTMRPQYSKSVSNSSNPGASR